MALSINSRWGGVGGCCTELRHSDRALRTAWFEKGDFKIGILKKHWVDFYHYRMDVYTLQHTFMFRQLEEWILHPMTPLNNDIFYVCCLWCFRIVSSERFGTVCVLVLPSANHDVTFPAALERLVTWHLVGTELFDMPIKVPFPSYTESETSVNKQD